MSLRDRIVAGAIGGFSGGVVMMGVMLAGKRSGMIEEPLPVKVEHKVEDVAGMAQRPTEQQEMAVGMGGHLAYSAMMGSIYGLGQSLFHLPAIPTAPLYGLGIYVINLLGVGPSLGITRGPLHEPRLVAGRRLMMHLVFGMVTGLVFERMLRRV